MEIKGLFRSGKVCACLDRSVRYVCGSNDVWVDGMIFPFGILIGIGVVVIVFLNARSGVGDVVAGGAGVCDGVGGRCKRRGRKRIVFLCKYLFITYFTI